jgi:hypothetical protein
MATIGITGHQEREGIHWGWVEDCFRNEISKLRGVSAGYSSLAVGSDQLFARVLLGLSIPVYSVIPLANYERFFHGEDLAQYWMLRKRCNVIPLNFSGSDEDAFLKAGEFVVDHVDVLFAVWDGQPAEGRGGTAEVVHYALSAHRSVLHINPIRRTVAWASRNMI